MSVHICDTTCTHPIWGVLVPRLPMVASSPTPAWVKFLNSIDHLLPCKATNMAVLDGKIIAWTDGPSWRIMEYLKREGIKTFSGLVQRRGCAPAGGPWCEVHREEIEEEGK